MAPPRTKADPTPGSVQRTEPDLVVEPEPGDWLRIDTKEHREQLRRLREPFPDEQVGKLPKTTCRDCSQSRTKVCERHSWVSRCGVCGNNHTSATMHLDFVGHAYLTARLLDVDPFWHWEPVAVDDFGRPILDPDGNLWISLTVAGMTRLGVGDGASMKERIGDALRNAAMRFGCALEMWAKGEIALYREDETPERDQPPRPGLYPAQETPPAMNAEVDPSGLDARSAEERDRAWRRWHASVPDGTQAQFMAAMESVTGRPFTDLRANDFSGFWKGMS